jgi:hypothetical protein
MYIQTVEYNDRIFKRIIEYNLMSLFKFPILLSGSFVIQAVLNETYENTDVNVYFIMKNEEDKANLAFHIENELHGIDLKFPSQSEFSRKYLTPLCVINLIGVNKCYTDLYQYILNTSDIDICTSSFDGYILKCPDGLLIKKANLINTENCHKTPTWVVAFANFLHIDKGHPLSNPNFLTLKMSVYGVKLIRMQKYLDRGFNILNKHFLIDYIHSQDLIKAVYNKIKDMNTLYYNSLEYSKMQMIYENMTSLILPRPRQEIVQAWQRHFKLI